MTISDLHALQLPNGGFASIVTSRHGNVPDCNGFTTALVLRATRRLPSSPALTQIRVRALQHVSSCSSPAMPGAFAFWPDAERPVWAASVPADVDDTAIMLTELARYGSLDRVSVLQRLCRAILPQRVARQHVHHLPSWIVPDAFYTWIGTGATGRSARAGVNLVDCCANANVVALMAFLDATHLPGYFQAIETICGAVGWAGRNRARLSAITPFYPSVGSLIDSLEHAVECGAESLEGALLQLRDLGAEVIHEPAGCCSSAYGSMAWHCAAVDAAHELARAAAASSRPHRLTCAAT